MMDEIEGKFTQLEAVVNKLGDRSIKQAAAGFRGELLKHAANLANQEQLERALAEIPERAQALAEQGKDTSKLVSELTGKQAEAAIARAVVEGSKRRVEAGWQDFQEAYNDWAAQELDRLQEQAGELTRAKLIPLCKGLLKELDSTRGTIAELEGKAASISSNGGIEAAELQGLAVTLEGLTLALAVKLGLEAMPMPLRSIAPESSKYWAPISRITEKMLDGNANGPYPTPADFALAHALATVLALPRAAREPLG